MFSHSHIQVNLFVNFHERVQHLSNGANDTIVNLRLQYQLILNIDIVRCFHISSHCVPMRLFAVCLRRLLFLVPSHLKCIHNFFFVTQKGREKKNTMKTNYFKLHLTMLTDRFDDFLITTMQTKATEKPISFFNEHN